MTRSVRASLGTTWAPSGTTTPARWRARSCCTGACTSRTSSSASTPTSSALRKRSVRPSVLSGVAVIRSVMLNVPPLFSTDLDQQQQNSHTPADQDPFLPRAQDHQGHHRAAHPQQHQHRHLAQRVLLPLLLGPRRVLLPDGGRLPDIPPPPARPARRPLRLALHRQGRRHGGLSGRGGGGGGGAGHG